VSYAAITIQEAKVLLRFHTDRADYARNCALTKKQIAKKEPLHRFGKNKTKEDWLLDAEGWVAKRKYHRKMARYWKKFIEAQP
jgi:hypothetical protein